MRGAVQILSRTKLEDCTCECYGVIQQYNRETGLKCSTDSVRYPTDGNPAAQLRLRSSLRAHLAAMVKELKNVRVPVFDAQAFLDSAGVARKVVEYRRSQKIYSQGDPATGV